ncbi:MAG: Asp-tRNA(Asn)/Glu-tRNA(Gln) amidotransferase subunit GatB [Deltaproteobacteria bacterium]
MQATAIHTAPSLGGASAYEPVIGLEVHAQLLTKSKIFCGCSTEFGALPNHHGCPVCLGMPGVLPVLNRQVVEFAIRAGLALECQIQGTSVWSRKHYFYPDLPKGYQISQFDRPICEGGKLALPGGKSVRIRRIHMEEDAGKNLHGEAEGSLVDFNRAGVPLLEIVSEPDISSAQEASDYLKALRAILMYLGVNDGNLEEGSLRCDANVSVRKVGSRELGTRAELKNMNSFRFLRQAIEFEIGRQIELLESGGRVVQETRGYDPETGVTRSLRSKEEAHDYRYFPEPDLAPCEVSSEWVARGREALPELPRARAARYEAQGVGAAEAALLTDERPLADFFERAAAHYDGAGRLAKRICNELVAAVRDAGLTFAEQKVTPAAFGELLRMVDGQLLSGAAMKELLAALVREGGDPQPLATAKGLLQVSDAGATLAAVDRVLARTQAEVLKYRAGKSQLIGFFVGQVMKEMGGKGNPAVIGEALKKKLG